MSATNWRSEIRRAFAVATAIKLVNNRRPSMMCPFTFICSPTTIAAPTIPRVGEPKWSRPKSDDRRFAGGIHLILSTSIFNGNFVLKDKKKSGCSSASINDGQVFGPDTTLFRYCVCCGDYAPALDDECPLNPWAPPPTTTTTTTAQPTTTTAVATSSTTIAATTGRTSTVAPALGAVERRAF